MASMLATSASVFTPSRTETEIRATSISPFRRVVRYARAYAPSPRTTQVLCNDRIQLRQSCYGVGPESVYHPV